MSEAINRAIAMLQDYKYDLASQNFSDNDEGDMLQRRNENKRATVDAAITGLRTELDALKAGQGEAVEVVAWSACAGSKKTFDFKCDAVAAINYFKSAFPNGHTDIIELMTVAQHERLIAAITAPPATDDAVSVPVELLKRLTKRVMLRSQEEAHADACEELRALLARQGVKS